ncbi:hypothetical protein NNJEOMEG_03790 [Fundidesulfovibrio magnetotacticus]|uniref:NADPH-dependent FMN reductase-like domain-containing protein n=1 Tax=Fundidesulfovibrio magnetotacticus TaxID=2730080 RepID=A0A6V8M271_9BACT|nr:flavodoxin family protein [Fundidesulfovibrio magnetotacticus]GFK95917.1 hypothetical protein NNJEOMEG_03790 [Fundidesulfovibrio magnetotacticus]
MHPAPGRPLILACSPRAGGNTDQAARLLARGLADAGADPEILALRDLDLLPCLGCQACARSPGHRCVLERRDRTEEAFARILAAPLVLAASPIYFYHLPGRFKGFIDRAQRFYALREAHDPALAALPPGRALACLVAGRTRGERLFEGALLTLKYFFLPLGKTLGEPLCLKGLDGPGDLEADGAAHELLRAYAARAWEASRT